MTAGTQPGASRQAGSRRQESGSVARTCNQAKVNSVKKKGQRKKTRTQKFQRRGRGQEVTTK